MQRKMDSSRINILYYKVDSLKWHVPYHRFLLIITIIFSILGAAPAPCAAMGVYDWAYVALDYAREEKVAALHRFCDRIHGLARQVAKDPFMSGCFDIHQQYSQAKSQNHSSRELEKTIDELERSLSVYFAENYFAFYDVLFVTLNGDIIHSMRKDYIPGANLITGEAGGSRLSQCLEAKPQEECFVDFFHYAPSAEPAAFFVEPVLIKNEHQGWLVLQLAVNKVNTIFAWIESLGQTGETFLVNADGLMLTESNFTGDSSILNRKLDDRNIQAKFKEGRGRRMVTDYRGCQALSSFEVVSFMGVHWLVVAKMDKDEIITQHYADHRKYYANRLMDQLQNQPAPPARDLDVPQSSKTLRIDMDEFLWAKKGERLYTFGVSTCTGFLAARPGRFGYMAHVSPHDKIYGGGGVNLVGRMVKRIESFDILPSEKRSLIFMVIAPGSETLPAIIDKLIEEGYLLSQILVLNNPQAESAAIIYDYDPSRLHVLWRSRGQTSSAVHTLDDAKNVGIMVKEIMQAEETG